MTPEVSAHALERYVERVLHATVAELHPKVILSIREEIAVAATISGKFEGLRDWCKRTKEGVFVVENGVVKTVLPPRMHADNLAAAVTHRNERERRNAEENHPRPKSRRRRIA